MQTLQDKINNMLLGKIYNGLREYDEIPPNPFDRDRIAHDIAEICIEHFTPDFLTLVDDRHAIAEENYYQGLNQEPEFQEV